MRRPECILAELLGWPHATIIMQIEKQANGIRVKRELESRILPVCGDAAAFGADHSVGDQQAALCHADRHQAGQEQTAAQGELDEGSAALKPNLLTIERLYIPVKTKQTEVMQGSPQEVAKKLVAKLRDEVRVL